LSLLLDVFISSAISGPLGKLKKATLQIRKGEPPSDIQISSGDEFQDLASSFVTMAVELEISRIELLSAKNYLDNIMHSMIDTLIVINSEFQIVTANKSVCTLLNFRESELLGKPITFVLDNENPFIRSAFQSRIRESAITNKEIIFKTQKGDLIPMMFSSSLMKGKSDQLDHIIIIAADIREKKKAEKEQRKFETQMQHAQKLESIGLLAGGIAHDFNNIMTAVLANVSIVQMQLKPEEESYVILSDAQKAVRQAKGLTRQLLTFSKGGAPIKKLVSLLLLLEESVSYALRG